MKDEVPLLPIRERIKDLNIKAYYLLVALRLHLQNEFWSTFAEIGIHFDGSCCRSAGTGLCKIQILVGVFSSLKSGRFDDCFGLRDFLDLDGTGNSRLDQCRVRSSSQRKAPRSLAQESEALVSE